MKRSDFIRSTFAVSGGLIMAPSLLSQQPLAKSKPIKLTVLHTNDTHSNIDPFPPNHAKYPGLGGVEQRFQLIEEVRKEEEHVLLIDAGDIFQGTPYFNKYKGVLEMKLMSELGYEVATMGNHDFDIGLDGFQRAKEFADFQFVCSNYDFSDTLLKNDTKDNVILKKGIIKVGIFGVGVQLKGLVPDSKYGATVYHDPIEIANQQALELTKKGCDLVICLSHLGYEYATDKISDRKLAQQTRNIHLIIGGHTHTFLDKPTEEKNLDNETVLINQVGWAGVNLGRIDFNFESGRAYENDLIEVR